MKKLLLTLFALSVFHFASAQCGAPVALTVTNTTSNSAVISWTSMGTETQWEILIEPADGLAPSPGASGIVTSVNPFTVTGLDCNVAYELYVKSLCTQTQNSGWAGPYNFSLSCLPQGGIPNDLAQCSDSNQACFDLSQNDSAIIGTLNPADYTFSYYASQADAASNTNPIGNIQNYCITAPASGVTPIFVRLAENAGGSVQISNFSLVVRRVVTGTALQPFLQCDEDGNGQISFDLTSVAAQLNTSNFLTYHVSSVDASNGEGVNAIPNPQAYTVSAVNSQTYSVFVREHVTGDCDVIYPLSISTLNNCNAASVCGASNSLCGSLGIPFNNTVGISNAEAGNDYGCLLTQPNPTWFYIPVSQSGLLSFSIAQTALNGGGIDVDFICYGPFSDPIQPCSGDLVASNTVACSYSTAAVENFSIPNAVSGQFYMLMVTNFANMPGQISINQIQGTGAIDCTGMNFTAFLDSNSNGMRDLGEVNFPLGEFHYTKNGGTLHNITSPSGSYGIYDINGSNVYDVSFTVDPSYASNYAVSPSSFMGLSVVPGSGLTEYYFPVSALQNYNDVGVAIIPNQQPRPGLQYTNTIKYTNYGNQTVSGSLSFTHDPLVSISSVSQAGTTPNAAGFSYNYTSLLPFESREIQVTMLVPPIPTVSLGWLLTNTASVASVSGDTVLENNTASSSQIIIGSYDPNDKMESHGGHIAINDFGAGDYLYYTIRFENTGTASAQDVRVYDVLDNSLEPTSVRMVDASHDFTLDRLDNQLTWRFDNINLPFSSSDPAGAKGFVTFKVKPKPGYVVGTVIPNTASIFFDLNPAIVTNTFYTEFVTNLGNESFTANELMIYPNPAGDLVNVSLNGGIIKAIVIYDMLGKKVFDRKAGAASETVDLSGVSPGIYLVEVTDAENQKVIKKLSVK